MPTVYVDPDGSNTSPYETWAKAATSLQVAIDYVSAGDVVYCRGSETPSATIDVDGTSGTAGAYIRFVGCNASGNVDGTRYLLDFGTNVTHGLSFNDKDYITFEHFEIKSTQAGGSGNDGIRFHSAYTYYINFINCYIHGWPDHGVDGTYIGYANFIRCRISTNGDSAIYAYGNVMVMNCTIDNHSGTYTLVDVDKVIGCVIRDNVNALYWTTGAKLPLCMNTVFYNNSGDDIVAATNIATIVGNRFIDHGAYGIDIGTATPFIMANYFDNSGSGDIDGTTYVEVNWDGAQTNGANHYTGGDTDDGFEDPANDDYNLRSDATNRSIPITLQG